MNFFPSHCTHHLTVGIWSYPLTSSQSDDSVYKLAVSFPFSVPNCSWNLFCCRVNAKLIFSHERNFISLISFAFLEERTFQVLQDAKLFHLQIDKAPSQGSSFSDVITWEERLEGGGGKVTLDGRRRWARMSNGEVRAGSTLSPEWRGRGQREASSVAISHNHSDGVIYEGGASGWRVSEKAENYYRH